MDDEVQKGMEKGFYKKVDRKYRTQEEKDRQRELAEGRQEKEKELIGEKVDYLEELHDDTLWDMVVIYFGISVIALALLVYAFSQFELNQSVKGLFVFGSIITLFGLGWKFILKRHFKKEEKKLKEEEEEIRQWDQV